MQTSTRKTGPRFGFSLVELMVVITIIGILSTIVYANFSTSRKIARDDQRKTDLKNMQVAIELYKKQYGHYPWRCPTYKTPATTTKDWAGNVHNTTPGTGYACNDGTTNYIVGLVPEFIAALPVDPLAATYGPASQVGYVYMVDSAGTGYKLLANATVEQEKIAAPTDDFARCPAVVSGQWCDDFSPGNGMCIGAQGCENLTSAVYSAGGKDW